MHELVVFVDLGGVGLTCKPGQSFLENVDSEWLVARDEYVNSQIELVTINKQRISYVSANDRQFINIHIVNVVNKHDASSLGSIGRLNDPNVLFAIVLLQFLVVLVKFAKFIREDVRIWDKVEILFPISFLHSDKVEAQPILSSNLMTLWKMIDFLIFIKTLIKVALTTR